MTVWRPLPPPSSSNVRAILKTRRATWMLQELLNLAEELCVARDRLDTALQLSAAGLVVDGQAIDAFEPEPELLAERLERHRALYTELFQRLD